MTHNAPNNSTSPNIDQAEQTNKSAKPRLATNPHHCAKGSPEAVPLEQEGEPVTENFDSDYHLTRARAELDCAYRAEHRRAVEAHLRLSAMHMQRLREVNNGSGSKDC